MQKVKLLGSLLPVLPPAFTRWTTKITGPWIVKREHLTLCQFVCFVACTSDRVNEHLRLVWSLFLAVNGMHFTSAPWSTHSSKVIWLLALSTYLSQSWIFSILVEWEAAAPTVLASTSMWAWTIIGFDMLLWVLLLLGLLWWLNLCLCCFFPTAWTCVCHILTHRLQLCLWKLMGSSNVSCLLKHEWGSCIDELLPRFWR